MWSLTKTKIHQNTSKLAKINTLRLETNTCCSCSWHACLFSSFLIPCELAASIPLSFLFSRSAIVSWMHLDISLKAILQLV